MIISESISVKKDKDTIEVSNAFGPLATAKKEYGGWDIKPTHLHEDQHPEVKHIFKNALLAKAFSDSSYKNKAKSIGDVSGRAEFFHKNLLTKSPVKEVYSGTVMTKSDYGGSDEVSHKIDFHDHETNEHIASVLLNKAYVRNDGNDASIGEINGKPDFTHLHRHFSYSIRASDEFAKKHNIPNDQIKVAVAGANNDPYKLVDSLKKLVSVKPVAVGKRKFESSHFSYSIPEGVDPKDAVEHVHREHTNNTKSTPVVESDHHRISNNDYRHFITTYDPGMNLVHHISTPHGAYSSYSGSAHTKIINKE